MLKFADSLTFRENPTRKKICIVSNESVREIRALDHPPVDLYVVPAAFHIVISSGICKDHSTHISYINK